MIDLVSIKGSRGLGEELLSMDEDEDPGPTKRRLLSDVGERRGLPSTGRQNIERSSLP